MTTEEGGFRMTPSATQVEPPLKGMAEGMASEIPSEIEAAEKARPDKVPLNPMLIKLPAVVVGDAAALITGFEGYNFSEEELKGIVEIWTQVDVRLNPLSQAIAGTVLVVSLKVAAHIAWIRAGKPALGNTRSSNGRRGSGRGSGQERQEREEPIA